MYKISVDIVFVISFLLVSIKWSAKAEVQKKIPGKSVDSHVLVLFDL